MKILLVILWIITGLLITYLRLKAWLYVKNGHYRFEYNTLSFRQKIVYAIVFPGQYVECRFTDMEKSSVSFPPYLFTESDPMEEREIESFLKNNTPNFMNPDEGKNAVARLYIVSAFITGLTLFCYALSYAIILFCMLVLGIGVCVGFGVLAFLYLVDKSSKLIPKKLLRL